MRSFFDKRLETPIEARNYSSFYLTFSALLFVGTIWSVWDEVVTRRPWKDYQSEYYELLAARYDSLQALAVLDVDSAEAYDLSQAIADARVRLESEEYVQTDEKKTALLRELDVATREWRFARSRSDAAYYQWKKALAEGDDGTDEKTELDEHEAEIASRLAEKTVLETEIAGLDNTLSVYTDAVMMAEADHAALMKEVTTVASKAEKTRLSPIGVRQVVRPDYEFTPFQEVKARVDRCQTCHAGWAEDLMEDAPQPFTKHPVPELLDSHNPEQFGCTPCHRGQGPALTAGFAHGDEDHYWETPILRGVDVYASCNACHYNESRLKFAGPFVKAKQLVMESGCFGCHEIKGFGDLQKIGPHLNSLTAKTNPEWIFRWVKNPEEYTPHTRMPNFEFTDEQAEAITAYLTKIGDSSDYVYERVRGSYSGGEREAGRRLFQTVGCIGCHVAGENTTVRDERGTSYDIAPELSRVGSKIRPDWAFDWLKNPRHYNVDSRMPSLRLTDQEAKHLVAFLMSLRDERSYPTVALNLSDEATIERGDRLIREFGCAGCHSIKGMENEGKVSVELSDFGRKKYEQMDYGDTKPLPREGEVEYQEFPDGTVGVRHTWAGWVYGKLKHARLYATQRIVQKMPLFSFNDEEIRLIRMFLLSMTKDIPLPGYRREYDKRMQDIEAGRRVTMRYNCQQCHILEEKGGYILALYEEAALGPPPIPESQGAKVQEPWLHEFFQNPSTIRPWLNVRMPSFQFSEDEISRIQKYFLGMAGQDLTIRDYRSVKPDPSLLGPGRRLFETYQCAKCHPSGPVAAEGVGDLAPDLAMANSRLKPEWIEGWLHDPQKLQPGTRMPSFFYEGMGPDESVFDGKAGPQIRALSGYVWSIGMRSPPRMAASH